MTHFGILDQEPPAGQTVIAEAAGSLAATHPPVFLHCGWRTRGTWIWNRFRGLPGIAGFYEPLAEQLAGLRIDTLASMNAASWQSGHVGVDRPYFDEFRPLLRPGRPGVRLYRSGFATGDFFAAEATALPALECYLRTLLHVAGERGEQPVLKFCRSIGRIGWMRRHFPDAVHIVVLRDPFSQFASAMRQYVRHGNGYFLAMPLSLLAMHRDLPSIRRCARLLGVDLPELADARMGLAASEAALRTGGPAEWYRGFLAFWLVTAAAMDDAADLVIDSGALARSGSYRRRCQMELRRLTGRTVDLGEADCPEARERPNTPLLRHSTVLHNHAAAEAFLAGEHGPAWADKSGLDLIARLLAEARSHALGGGETPRHATPARSIDDPETVATLLSATVRAEWAERELAAVWASRSWRVTAPLRWLRRCVGQSAIC